MGPAALLRPELKCCGQRSLTVFSHTEEYVDFRTPFHGASPTVGGTETMPAGTDAPKRRSPESSFGLALCQDLPGSALSYRVGRARRAERQRCSALGSCSVGEYSATSIQA